MPQQFLVQGHTIPLDGKTLNPITRLYDNSPGPTRCSCGLESPSLPSTYARRNWGVAHKKEMVANGARLRSGAIPPQRAPSPYTVTRKCLQSGQLCADSLDPTFDNSARHVSCPSCLRTLHIRDNSTLYPTHYLRLSPTRDDEIAKTRIKPIPGLFVTGLGRGWKATSPIDQPWARPARWQVHRLTYNRRSYQLWRDGKDHMWTISPDDDAAFVDKTMLACAGTFDEARGIVVDWGAGGSVYEDYRYDPPRDRKE